MRRCIIEESFRLLCVSIALVVALLGNHVPARAALPEIDRLTLDNGLQLLLLPNGNNPYMEVHWISRVGTGSDPLGKEGLISMMAAMLTNGTEGRSEQELAATVEDMGATLSAWATLDSVDVSGSVITLEEGARERFLGILHDVLRHATLPEDALVRTRELRLSTVARLADNHDALADAAFLSFLYGDAPRGRPGQGNLSTLPTLTRGDLLWARDAILVPSHSILAIAGDFDRAQLIAWAKTHLGSTEWGQGVCQDRRSDGRFGTLCVGHRCLQQPSVDSPTDNDTGTASRRVLLVHRGDPSISQIQWRLGMSNPVGILDEDWGAFRLGTHVLGGDFTARLNSVLRVREGLTYGARFLVSYGARDSGPMRVSTYVAPSDLDKAIALAVAEIDAVSGAPLDAQELAGFKAKIINGFPFKFETISDTLEQYLMLASDGIPVSWLEQYVNAIQTPDAAAVHRSLQRVDSDKMVLVAVGNEDLIPTLSKWGEVNVIDVQDFLSTGLEKIRAAGDQ